MNKTHTLNRISWERRDTLSVYQNRYNDTTMHHSIADILYSTWPLTGNINYSCPLYNVS